MQDEGDLDNKRKNDFNNQDLQYMTTNRNQWRRRIYVGDYEIDIISCRLVLDRVKIQM